jgi:cyanophycinase
MEQPRFEDFTGALIIIGGNGTPAEVYDLFFQLAGGCDARVIHIPSSTSTFHEIEDRREYYCDFYDRGPRSFEFLHTDDRAEAEASDFARPLDEATGVWIGGGNQNRLASLFLDTGVVPGIQRVLRRGGVVAGTSSGAAIASERMICFGYTQAELDRGFALYPKTIVDAHFTQRFREHRLAHGVLQSPDCVGVGVDERTALIVQGRRLSVVGAGEGSVWFYFADRASNLLLRFRLEIGQILHLETSALGAHPEVLCAGLHAQGAGQLMTLEELFRPEALA